MSSANRITKLVLLIGAMCVSLSRTETVFADYTASGLVAVEWWIDTSDDIYLVDVKLGPRGKQPAQLKLNRVIKSASGNKQLPPVDLISSEFFGKMVRGDQLLVFARINTYKRARFPVDIAQVVQITRTNDYAESMPISKHGKYFRTPQLAIEYVEQRLKERRPRLPPSLFKRIDGLHMSVAYSGPAIEGVVVLWIDTEVNRDDTYFYMVAPADEDLRDVVLAGVAPNLGLAPSNINSLINFPGKETEAALERLQTSDQDWVSEKAKEVLLLLREKARENDD